MQLPPYGNRYSICKIERIPNKGGLGGLKEITKVTSYVNDAMSVTPRLPRDM